MSWYHTGEEAEEYVDQKAEEASEGKLFRYWMPAESEQHITFVDNPVHDLGFKLPFVFLEHQLHLNGHWKNWFTCIQNLVIVDDDGKPVLDGEGKPKKQKCPLCAGGDKPALVAAYTVIDHNEWTDKGGKVHVDEVKLYVVKSKVLKVLRKAAKKKDGLRGWKVEVSRTDDKSPNSGDQFDFEERVKLPKEIVSANYPEEFVPKSVEQLMELIGEVADETDETVRF